MILRGFEQKMIKAIGMQIAVILMNILYVGLLPLKLKEKVTIISRQSDTASIDVRLLQKELAARQIDTVVLTKRLHKNLYSGIKYGFHMLRQMYHIATSKVVVLDGYCILVSVLHKKRQQSVIQMWHALGAIKKFGYQTVGKPGGNRKAVAKVMQLHNNYDYVLASSEETGKIYQEAFGVDAEKIRYMGLPRIDYLKKEDPGKTEAIYQKYPQLRDRINVLYAPTFRKNTEFNLSAVIDAFDFTKYNLIIKKHWLDKENYKGFQSEHVIVDRKFNSMDWLKLCDKVITDYSAITFEAALLQREVYLYLPDIYEYKKDIGLNMDYSLETIGTYACVDAENLCRELSLPYEKQRIAEFQKKYLAASTENCAARLADFTRELLTDEEREYSGCDESAGELNTLSAALRKTIL